MSYKRAMRFTLKASFQKSSRKFSAESLTACLTAITTGMICFPRLVFAHPGHGLLTFYAGFFHPILGLDHLLTAVAVGVWSGSNLRTNRSFAFKGPLSFLGGMVVGVLAGQVGFALPFCEQGILLSLAMLGFCLFARIKSQSWFGGFMLSLFGAFHGNAHGLEVTQQTLDGPALVGLLLSTGTLHCLGVLGVSSVRKWFTEERAVFLLRWVGAGLIGSVFIL